MALSPITSWQINGETMETMTDFIFLGCKITAAGDCSYEIKRHLLLERKVMTNLDSVLKSRDITLPTKVCLVKAMVFPVVTYGCSPWGHKESDMTQWLSWTEIHIVAKLLQSCPTLCDPVDCSLPGFSVHGILQARTLEWVAISFSKAWKWKVKVESLTRVRLVATPWTAAY